MIFCWKCLLSLMLVWMDFKYFFLATRLTRAMNYFDQVPEFKNWHLQMTFSGFVLFSLVFKIPFHSSYQNPYFILYLLLYFIFVWIWVKNHMIGWRFRRNIMLCLQYVLVWGQMRAYLFGDGSSESSPLIRNMILKKYVEDSHKYNQGIVEQISYYLFQPKLA